MYQSLRLWQSLRQSVSSSAEKVPQPLVQTRGGRCRVCPCSRMSVARRTLHVGEHLLRCVRKACELASLCEYEMWTKIKLKHAREEQLSFRWLEALPQREPAETTTLELHRRSLGILTSPATLPCCGCWLRLGLQLPSRAVDAGWGLRFGLHPPGVTGFPSHGTFSLKHVQVSVPKA